MTWPFTAGVVRLLVVVALGWYWTGWHHGSLTGLFWIVALSQFLFGAINAVGLATGLSWRKAPARREVSNIVSAVPAPGE